MGGGRLQRTWNPHLDDEERTVPFTDQGQIEFLARLQRKILRMERSHRFEAALMDDVASSVNSIAEAVSVLYGSGRIMVFDEEGKKVIRKLTFKAVQIKREEKID